MKRSYQDLEHQFTRLTELKAAIAYTYLSNMSDVELETIPLIVVPEETLKHVIATGIVIDLREDFTIYEWGNGFARLKIQTD